MRLLQVSLTLSIWPMVYTAGHEFDGEIHKWWAAIGPVGATVYFEPRQASAAAGETAE